MIRRLPVAMLALTVGCGPDFERLVIHTKSLPPDEVRLAGEPFVIAPGNAVVVEVEPKSGNGIAYDDDAWIDLVSEDPRVFDVVAGAQRREFALVGVAEGETCMQVIIDGDHVDCIDVLVTARRTAR